MATIKSFHSTPYKVNVAAIHMQVDLGATGKVKGDIGLATKAVDGNAFVALVSGEYGLAELGNNWYDFSMTKTSGANAGANVAIVSGATINRNEVQFFLTANKDANDVYVDFNAGTAKVTPATGAITAATIAADALTSGAFAASSVSLLSDGVWDELLAGHSGAGSAGKTVADMVASVWAAGTRELTGLGAGAIASIWNALTSGMVTVGSIGKLIVTNLDAVLSTSATAVTAIKAKTDKLTYDGSNNILSSPQTTVALSTAGLTAVENEILDAPLASHDTANTVGQAVNDAQALAMGKREIISGGTVEKMYKRDNATVRGTFNLTLDASNNITKRTT